MLTSDGLSLGIGGGHGAAADYFVPRWYLANYLSGLSSFLERLVPALLPCFAYFRIGMA